MKILLRATVFVAVAGLLAGCSAQTTETAPSTSGESNQAEALEDAEAFLDQFEERPTEITVSEPLGTPVPESGEIHFIQCGVPACVAMGDSLQEATDLLGWKLKRLQGGLTAETIKDAWAQSASANPAPSGVIGTGFNENIIADEVKALADKGVPAISISTNDEIPPTGNLAAVLGSGPARNVTIGEIQAAAVIKDAEGEPNAVYVYSPSLESTIPEAEGFEAKYAELCPSCEVDLLQIAPESIGANLPQEIAAYLQAHPKVTHVALAFGDMGVGLPSALQTAGMEGRVRMITDTPGITVSSYMASDDLFFAATGFPGQEFIWTAVDVILRDQLGLDTSPSADSEILQWLITPETLPSSTEEFPIVADYQEQFATLWDVN